MCIRDRCSPCALSSCPPLPRLSQCRTWRVSAPHVAHLSTGHRVAKPYLSTAHRVAKPYLSTAHRVAKPYLCTAHRVADTAGMLPARCCAVTKLALSNGSGRGGFNPPPTPALRFEYSREGAPSLVAA
eukprot:1903618-Rhodomonas_salina.1